MKAWRIARYTLLPEIVPRLGRLFFSGYGPVSFFMARACAALRLLPRTHPYLNPANYGRFSLMHVLTEAKRSLRYDRAHMDQVVLYYALVLGFFLFVLQFALLLVAFGFKSAFAADAINVTLSQYFVTQNYQTDIAYNLLDLIFAFAGIFNSDSLAKANNFHTALHTLFHFYNLGILAVAILVFLYLVVTVVAETAESGTPFGRRFNHAMVPLRLIFAIGLLTPLAFGMNGGQLMTMYIAKWGSSLATNGWNVFMDTLGTDATPGGARESLVIQPEPPTVNGLIEYMFVVMTCAHYQKLMYGRTINGYLIAGDDSQVFLPYRAPGAGPGPGPGGPAVSFADALTFFGNRNFVIRFGEKADDYASMQGQVNPYCGEMTFSIKDVTQPGARTIQEDYYNWLSLFWNDASQVQTSYNLALRNVPNELRDPLAPLPGLGGQMPVYINASYVFFNNRVFDPANGNGYIVDARNAQINDGNWAETFRQLGWGGSAIWYNKLAEMNGAFMAAVQNLPQPTKYPQVMETVMEQKRQTDQSIVSSERFRPYKADGSLVDFANSEDKYQALLLYQAQQYWRSAYSVPVNNSILDTIKAIFGLESLFSMRRNIDAGVNPLVQLAGLGRGLVESGVANLAVSFGSRLAGGLGNFIGAVPAKLLSLVSSFTSGIAYVALAIGIILYYVIPFLPFLYFFFSIGTWLKSIFQALVAIPLWAISHMTLDGEGLPGRSSMHGYHLLMEVFIRPVLIVTGLVGSIVVFASEAYILNEIWDIVTSNLTGFNYATATQPTGNAGTTTGSPVGSFAAMRGVLDMFMSTVMYAIVVYMMALSSFKMADLLPDNIIRWLGGSASSFGDADPNPAEKLLDRITHAGAVLSVDGPMWSFAGRNGK